MKDEELSQAALAEAIVSSEPFMWLMLGPSDWTPAHIDALRGAYKDWKKMSGGYARYNGLASRLHERKAKD